MTGLPDDVVVRRLVETFLQGESEQTVRDMARHVGDEVHGVLKRHGMLMKTTGGAIGVGVLAAAQVLGDTMEFARRSMDGDADDEQHITAAVATLFYDVIPATLQPQQGSLKPAEDVEQLRFARGRLSKMADYGRIDAAYGDFSHPATTMIADVRKLLSTPSGEAGKPEDPPAVQKSRAGRNSGEASTGDPHVVRDSAGEQQGEASMWDIAKAFFDAVHERTPNGEWIAVQHHPDGDWSVAHHPLPWLPATPSSSIGDVDRLREAVVRVTRYCDEYEDAPSWGGPTMYPSPPSVADLRLLAALNSWKDVK